MRLSNFDTYLIIINVIGFVLFVLNTWLYNHTVDKQIDSSLTITSLLGGSLGIFFSILVFDRSVVKKNLMSRVFLITVLVIQIIIFLVVKGFIVKNITLAFLDFFLKYKGLLYYLGIMNFITFAVYGYDKIAAYAKKYRIRNVTLLGLAFFGGSLGALLAIYLYRHKTNKAYFTHGVPLIILMQVVIILYLMNTSWFVWR